MDRDEMKAQLIAAEFVIKSKKVPDQLKYDWVPFFTGLQRTSSSLIQLDPENYEENDKHGRQVPTQDCFTNEFDPLKIPSKDPDSGSWKYVWYIPEWTHPNFDPTVIRTYTGRVEELRFAEAVASLRPALRTEDAIWNPTDYAKRFGIHPDERNRSRTSPTLSTTRDPFEDLANQINMLDDTQKQQAIDASKVLWQSQGGQSTGSQFIDPNIMEQILQQKGVLGNKELVDRMKLALGNSNLSLEEFVDQLNTQGPLIAQAHKTFIANALRDQDWQRIMFNSLTTDELIAENAHTLSDNYFCDLGGELHPILRRDHWEDSSWKGAMANEPRYLYNLNGKREEWDASTNDVVWKALQPSLQLVSRVLENRHPHLEALMNIETREPIHPGRDPRAESATDYLTKYVLEEDITEENMYEDAQELKKLGYDWKYHTWRVLEKCLRLDIGSCYVIAGDHEGESGTVDGVLEETSMIYGTTHQLPAGPDSQIVITLAAELIWPLMVEEYSQSEKMTCAFVLAAVLLHEFGHAIMLTHGMLMANNWTKPPGQPDLVTHHLCNLANELFDYGFGMGEPCYADNAFPEVGYEVEQALWGGTICSLLEGLSPNSRQLQCLPLIAMCRAYPWSRLNDQGPTLLDAEFPIEDFMFAMPLEWTGRLFTCNFWDTEFKAYGFQALKQMPPHCGDRMIKNLDNDVLVDHSKIKDLFGIGRVKFLTCISWALRTHGYPMLSQYLRSQLEDTVRAHSFYGKWTRIIKNWSNDTVNSLNTEVDKLRNMLQQSQTAHSNVGGSEQRKQNIWFEYVQNYNGAGTVMDYPTWKANTEKTWFETFRIGGTLITQLGEVSRYMQQDISFLERMVFDFFNTELPLRERFFTGKGPTDNSPIGAAYKRISGFKVRAESLSRAVGSIAKIPQLVDIWQDWGLWRAIFEKYSNTYDNMLKLLNQEPATVGPDNGWWMSSFKTIPTWNWKRRHERFQSAAFREYQRLEPRVRKTVDQYGEVLGKVKDVAFLPQQADLDTVNSLIGDIANNWDENTNQVIDGKATIFDFKLPAVAPPGNFPLPPGVSIPPPPPPPPAPAGPSTSANPSGNITFNVPGLAGTSLGGEPSRRTVWNPPTTGGFMQYSGGSNALVATAPPGGGSAQYPRPWGGEGQGSAFGSGNPFAPAPPTFGPGSGRSWGPFPAAYAIPSTLSADVAGDQQRQGIAELTMNTVPDPYVSPQQWRSPPGSSGQQ